MWFLKKFFLIVLFIFDHLLMICVLFVFFSSPKVILSFRVLSQNVLPQKQISFSKKGQNHHKIHLLLEIFWKTIGAANQYFGGRGVTVKLQKL
jgi:hypothetical protein